MDIGAMVPHGHCQAPDSAKTCDDGTETILKLSKMRPASCAVSLAIAFTVNSIP